MNEQLEEYKKTLEAFNREEISYCLLRNYEFLLGENYPVEGLDTLVSKKDIEKVDVILTKLGFAKRRQQFSLSHKAYFKLVDTKMVSFDIQVGGIHWNDMPYLREEVLQHRLQKGFFYTPNDDDTFIILLLHSILGKRYFKKKYQQILRSLDINEPYVIRKVSAVFNEKIAHQLLHATKDGHFDQIPIYSLLIHFIFSKPKNLATFTKLFFRWLRWKKPLQPAPLIAIIGPDGAGKSTLVRSLNHHLMETKRKTVIVYTGRGKRHFLPITKIGKIYKRAEKKTDQSRALPKKRISLKRKILYTLTAPVFTLDLLLRYYFNIFPKRLHHKIVVSDRYCSDIMTMEHVPLRFKNFLLSLFAKPTLTIFVYNDVSELLSRRPLESAQNLERQLQLYEKFPYSLKIKTDDPEQVRQTVIEFIEKKLLIDWW